MLYAKIMSNDFTKPDHDQTKPFGVVPIPYGYGVYSNEENHLIFGVFGDMGIISNEIDIEDSSGFYIVNENGKTMFTFKNDKNSSR